MNKKGFTIIEVVAVILIITALSLLIVPNVMNYLNSGKERHDDNLKDMMSIATKNYYSDHENKRNLSRIINYITLKELSSTGYTNGDFVDSLGNSCVDKSYIVEYEQNGSYTYYPCMICGSKKYFSDDDYAFCNLELFEERDDLLSCHMYKDDGVILEANSSAGIEKIYGVSRNNKYLNLFVSNSLYKPQSYKIKLQINSKYIVDLYMVDDNYNKIKCGSIVN